MLSVNGRIVWVNRRFSQMIGHPADVLPGRSARELETSPSAWERFRSDARAALAGVGTYSCEHELRRADGVVRRLHMSGTCLHERDPDSGVLWTFGEAGGEAVSALLPARDPVHPG